MSIWKPSTRAAAGVAALLCAGGLSAVLAAPSVQTIATGAPSANSTANGRANGAIWATYKGDAQRTGSGNIPVRLPLSLLWRYTSDADPGAIFGSPLVVGAGDARRVLFNAGKNLYCLDAESGENLWTFKGDSILRAPITLLPGSNDTVLTLSSKGTASALRVSDGVAAWTYQADSALRVAPLVVRTVRGDRIILAPNSGTLVALTPQGAVDPAWRVGLGAGGAAPTSAPVASADGKRIFVPANDGNLYGIDVRGARVSFAVNLGNNATVTPVSVGNLVFAAAGNTLVATRVDNGAAAWRSAAAEGDFASLSAQPLAQDNGVIYAGTTRGALMALNARDGKLLWQTAIGRASLSGSPLVLRGVVLVGGRDGVFYGVDSAKGQLLWRYRLESERRVLVPVREPLSGTGSSGGGIGSSSGGQRSGFGGGGSRGGGGSSQRGGGSGTGNRSARAAATPTPMMYETRTYGVSSAPAAVDGRIYVPVDNAALYAFSSSAFDAAPPTVTDTKIVFPTDIGSPFVMDLTPDFPGIPAKGPVSLTLDVSDAGSGIDASRIRTSFDGQPVPAQDIKFDQSTGLLTLNLFKSRGDATLSDGTHKVQVEVRDYNGNATPFSTSFIVNSTFVPPVRQDPNAGSGASAPQQPQRPQWGGPGGGFGGPGGGGPGGGGWRRRRDTPDSGQ